MGEYKVLITTSGIGSRLGELTKYTNKSLVRVGKKPAISYIVESYPENIELVITLGYYGNQVRDFLNLAYPNRKFNFVEVDKYDGEGSSLGYSLLKAKDDLQCPFIFHASDTIIIDELLSEPTTNWIAGSKGKDSSQYRTITKSRYVNIINDKGSMDFDLLYIGLAGIKDYMLFWTALETEYKKNENNQSLSDCDALNYFTNLDVLYVNAYNWLDIGNSTELKNARVAIGDKFELLDKVDESIFLFENFVIKFFYDKKVCRNRVKRCEELGELTPKLIGYSDNFYKYEYANGDLLATIVNDNIFKEFLYWSRKNLWVEHETEMDIYSICKEFYFDKTKQRLDRFFKEHNLVDSSTTINGVHIPSIGEMLSMIDEDWLCSAKPYQFHGDYILDNIIYEGKDKFKLLDWRQDFGGDLKNGDIYYDLAKLNHNLLFNHDIVHKGLFTVKNEKNGVTCDILRSDNLTNCREYFHKWIVDNGFDLDKVKVLTAIIWLNMAPLHDYKMGEFLFYFGKLNLYKSIKK